MLGVLARPARLPGLSVRLIRDSAALRASWEATRKPSRLCAVRQIASRRGAAGDSQTATPLPCETRQRQAGPGAGQGQQKEQDQQQEQEQKQEKQEKQQQQQQQQQQERQIASRSWRAAKAKMPVPEDRESPLSAPRGGDGAFGLASYKIVLVGDSGVGKTNLLAAFVAANEARLAGARGEGGAERGGPRGGYSEQRQPTIGCEFYSCSISHPLDKTKINVQIWDTAGQERYRSISAGQYRRASGALLVYDVTSRGSLESALTYWHSELAEWPLADCLCLVGNKGTCPALFVERCFPHVVLFRSH